MSAERSPLEQQIYEREARQMEAEAAKADAAEQRRQNAETQRKNAEAAAAIKAQQQAAEGS